MNIYCTVCDGEMEILEDLNSEIQVAPCGCTSHYARATELLRVANKTGGVVVELHKGRYLRDWITELLAEIDGKEQVMK